MKFDQVSVRPIGSRAVRLAFIVFLAVSLVALQGCRKKLDLGKLEGGVYTNEFFSMRLTLPSQWVVGGEAEEKRLREAGAKTTIQTNNPIRNWAIKKSAQRTTQLLLVSKGAWGTTPLNSSIICMAEQIPALSTVSRGSEYLASMKSMLQYSSVSMRIAQDVYPVEVGGKLFYGLGVAVKAGPMEIPQTYYAYVSHGYALVFIITTFTDEDRETIDSMIKSIAFKA